MKSLNTRYWFSFFILIAISLFLFGWINEQANAAHTPIHPIKFPYGTTDGITVEPATGLLTTEQDGQSTFTIVLTTPPTSTVTINLLSSDTTEGTVSPTPVIFQTDSWNIAQTVTVTGVDDNEDDGDITYTILTQPAVSADPNYSNANADDVSVTNQDNDVAGITVNPTTLTTTEAGGSATFEMVLTSQPTADVSIALSGVDTSEGSVSPISLNFIPSTWNQAQSATVTGVDDHEIDGNIGYNILTSASSADLIYNAIDPADVSVTNQDNDVAGITVNPTTLTTSEAGGSDSFSVVLTSQPTANVSISLSGVDSSEGSVSTTSLTFTPSTWNQSQSVTVTGVNDQVDDGDITYTITTEPAVSTDPHYWNLNPADVSVTNQDNDSAGITVNPNTLTTTEAGGSAAFSVVLTSQPTANVSISLSGVDSSEGTVSSTSLTFTSTNWNQPQSVTVTGVDDHVIDGNITYTILTSASSADLTYNAIDPADVSVTNQDNDSAGITVNPTTLTTTEAGGTAMFSVVLTSQPAARVSINLSSSDTTEGTIAPTSLAFTAQDWYRPQMVTITGVDDSIEDGDVAYSILTAPATSNDTHYSGMNAADVMVTNSDDDVSGIILTPIAGLVTGESGVTDEFTVTLSSAPFSPVTIELSSTDLSEGIVTPISLTFTVENWTMPQIVILTGVDDALDDGDIAYTIITNPATSADPKYSGMNPADISAINQDDEDRPVAVDDVYSLVEDNILHELVPGILGNDSMEGESMRVLPVTDVSNGTLSLKIDGSFTYTPTANSSGEDTFTYLINDGIADSNIAKVTLIVEPVNDAPIANPDEYLSRGIKLTIQKPGVLANDVDVDSGDTLAVILDETTINGTLTLEADGSFTYSPAYADFNGIDIFKYHTTDGSLGSGMTEAKIMVDSIPPTITWLTPINDGDIFYVTERYIQLEVEANDDQIIPVLPIDHVYICRWDAQNKVYVDIGSVDTPPFVQNIDALELNYGWNQIFATAYDTAGNQSERKFIWIYRMLDPRVFLPLTSR